MAKCPVILFADKRQVDIDAIATQLESGLQDVVMFVEDLHDAKLAIAIGGDGTLIKHGRMLATKGVPLIGVNSGRLGFIAKFDAECLVSQRDSVFTESPDIVSSQLLEVQVDEDEPIIAMNEAMIAAGSPFRILELGLSIDSVPAPTLRGDGILIATPLGSTAHNASVGGPIVDPSAHAFVLSPLAAHSLAFRPIVLDASADVTVNVLQANEGTSLVIDGEVHCTLKEGMKVRMCKSQYTLSIVLNPTSTYWNALVDKLHWAAPPG